MTFKFRNATAALIAAGALCAGSAQAGIVVNDWTLNLTGIDGLGTTVVNGVDQIQFTGVAHAQATIDSGLAPAVGDTATTRGLLTGTSLLHNGGVILANGGMNTAAGYELTFTFEVGSVTTFVSGPNSNFTHTAGPAFGASGLLKIYVDNLANGLGAQSDQGTGAGYSDGVLVATFMVQAGLGGGFNALTFNGSDDAAFSYVSGLAGVILDGPGGNDLGNNALIAVTASQFDADFDNDGTPDVACPSNGVIGVSGTFSPTNFCAQEDGRGSFQTQIPEPGSLALVGVALAGLGFLNRRKASKVSVA